jgi:2-dehydro-3-deoxyglucarate aldolase
MELLLQLLQIKSKILIIMQNTSLKSKLKNNELTIGSWITIGHPSVIEVLAQAGFDWLTIDMEHTSIDYSMAQTLISTIQSNDMAALVRVSKNDEVYIKRVLDAGADGVIVPMIKSADDAKKAVEYVKYPPEGKRGVGLYRAQKFGLNNGFEHYKKWLSENSVIIAQIEHIDAVNNIKEIIATPGIDGVIIGPYDLSGSMGIPGEFDNPKVIEAITRVEQVCKDNNFPSGYHVIQPESKLLQDKIDNGFTFLAFSTDFFFMGVKANYEINKIKRY